MSVFARPSVAGFPLGKVLVAVAFASSLAAPGCGSTSAAREGTTARVAVRAPEAQVVAVATEDVTARLQVSEQESAGRGRRIRELESRLAMRDAEVRDLREEVDQQASEAAEELAASRPSLRIRAAEPEPDAAHGAEPATPEPEHAEDEPRVVLRLYGPPPAFAGELPPVATTVDLGTGTPGAMRAPLYLPAPPPAGLGRLPVFATSGAMEPVPPIPEQPVYVVASPAPRVDGSVAEYQAALQLVSARRFEDAFAALSAFLRAHPDHSYADNAMYWRAETLYARRDFRGAELELGEMVRRFPQGNKVSDALLRLGFCRQRQGDPEGARQYFRRVVAGFPGSVAARLASREDT